MSLNDFILTSTRLRNTNVLGHYDVNNPDSKGYSAPSTFSRRHKNIYLTFIGFTYVRNDPKSALWTSNGYTADLYILWISDGRPQVVQWIKNSIWEDVLLTPFSDSNHTWSRHFNVENLVKNPRKVTITGDVSSTYMVDVFLAFKLRHHFRWVYVSGVQ